MGILVKILTAVSAPVTAASGLSASADRTSAIMPALFTAAAVILFPCRNSSIPPRKTNKNFQLRFINTLGDST
jgi:hypothetical protein